MHMCIIISICMCIIIYTHNLYITIHPPRNYYKIMTQINTPWSKEVLQYEQWLLQWITNLRDAPSMLTIPPSASRIHMPMNSQCRQDYLSSHPSQKLVQLFLNGLVQGFRIGFNNSINSLRSTRRNL